MSERSYAVTEQFAAPDPARLASVISPLRRALLSASRAAGDLPELPDSHIQVIRALSGDAGRSPSELADELHLDRSTVSNLLATMESAGLVERSPSQVDRRRVLVSASVRARELFASFDRSSSAILADALAVLTAKERLALADALPALERLAVVLTQGPDPSAATPVHSPIESPEQSS